MTGGDDCIQAESPNPLTKSVSASGADSFTFTITPTGCSDTAAATFLASASAPILAFTQIETDRQAQLFVQDAPPPGSVLKLFLDVDNTFSVSSPTSDIDSYLPGSNLDGSSVALSNMPQTVKVIAAFVDMNGTIVAPPSGVSQVSFALQDTSAFKGMAMNWGTQTTADFSLAAASASFSADNTARVDLLCHDYGGFATVQASAGGQSASMRVPKDDNGNWLPDWGWIAETAQISDSGLGRDRDEDNAPFAAGPPLGGEIGDGLTNFEEYRGFIVRGSHRRTNPFKKDLFISSNLNTGIAFAFPNLPTATHRVKGIDESGTPEYHNGSATDQRNRVINFNFENSGFGGNIPAHFDQKALRVRRVNRAPNPSFFGLTSLIPGQQPTPNGVIDIQVYVDNHMNLATTANFTSNQIDNEFKRTTGHEVGHGVHICGRPPLVEPCLDGWNPGTVDSIMTANVTGTPQNDPLSQYNDFDIFQIRLHVRF